MSKFNELYEINVNERTEKKGKLTYLSWAWAWSQFKKSCPDAVYTVNEDKFYADGSCMVSTSVTADGETHEMWLPVMDNRNNAIENPDSRKISDARMRCFTKNLAMFGLGLYIYAGEDLPEEDTAEQERKNALKKAKGAFFVKHEASDIEAVKKAFVDIEGIKPKKSERGDLHSLVMQVDGIEKLANIDKAIGKAK